MATTETHTPNAATQPLKTHAQTAKLFNVRLNKLGHVAFDGQFGAMKAATDFVVHQLSAGTTTTRVVIQSERYIGWITSSGVVFLSPQKSSGVAHRDIGECLYADTISHEELFFLRTLVFSTAATATETPTKAAKAAKEGVAC